MAKPDRDLQPSLTHLDQAKRKFDKPRWMSHKQYWYLRKHDPAKLDRLISSYPTGTRAYDPLDDLDAAIARDGT